MGWNHRNVGLTSSGALYVSESVKAEDLDRLKTKIESSEKAEKEYDKRLKNLVESFKGTWG